MRGGAAGGFPLLQDENDDAVLEVGRGSSKSSDWVSTLMDYLYVSTTNSTAFSLTDTMPLTSRAKALMALELISALGAVGHRDRARRRLAQMTVLPPRVTTLSVGRVSADGGGDRSAQHVGQRGHGGNHLPRR